MIANDPNQFAFDIVISEYFRSEIIAITGVLAEIISQFKAGVLAPDSLCILLLQPIASASLCSLGFTED